VAGAVVALRGGGILLFVVGFLLELFALGCLSLALFGVLQRLHGDITDEVSTGAK
jgi:hypothetical protein